MLLKDALALPQHSPSGSQSILHMHQAAKSAGSAGCLKTWLGVAHHHFAKQQPDASAM